MYSLTEIGIKASKVWIENKFVCIKLSDERELRFPTSKNRRLEKATPKQLKNVELIYNGSGLHWKDLNEDLSIVGILEGRFG